MNAKIVVIGCMLLLPCVAGAASVDVQRGRYLVKIGGCNDCHTAGYVTSGGSVPEAQWLTGQAVGFKGSWGISYPANLRLLVRAMSEEQWIHQVGQPALPPSGWRLPVLLSCRKSPLESRNLPARLPFVLLRYKQDIWGRRRGSWSHVRRALAQVCRQELP